jgi:hypothetical protein
MKWLPKPSLRTAVGLGAIAAVIMATRPRRGKRRNDTSGNVSGTDEMRRLVETSHGPSASAASPRHGLAGETPVRR